MKVKWLALLVLLCNLVLVIVLPFNLGIFSALLAVTLIIAGWAIRSLSVKLTSSGDNNQDDYNGDYNDSTRNKVIIFLSHVKRIIKMEQPKANKTGLFKCFSSGLLTTPAGSVTIFLGISLNFRVESQISSKGVNKYGRRGKPGQNDAQ